MALTLSRRGIDKIFGFEVSSPAYYQKYLSGASWPGGDSGVTFGVGYDLGYNTREQIKADWTGLVNGNVLAYMLSVTGLKGESAKKRIPEAKGLTVPIAAAQTVFEKKSIPRFARLAERAFPEMDKLLPDVQSMIVSLCFNRGTALKDSVKLKDAKDQEKNRLEMRKIADAAKIKDNNSISAAFRSMKRLWDGIPDFPGDIEEKVQGLINRREEEAQIIDHADRQYAPSELVVV